MMMPQRFKVWLPLIIFGAMAILFAVLLLGGRNAAVVTSALIGKPVPTAVIEGLAQKDFPKGDPYIVNFFASWCVSCRAEQKILDALSKETGVKIYGVAYKDEPAATEKWLSDHGNPFAAIGKDYDGRVALEWGVYGVPETFVIDAAGIIRMRIAGAVTPASAEDMKELLKAGGAP